MDKYRDTVLITGATSGIGKECALLLSQEGYTVYAISRSAEDKIVENGKGKIIYRTCDVTKEEDIERIIAELSDLSIIIHSAGFGIAGSAEDSDIDLVREQMETDYYAILNLNRKLLPILRKKKKGLVIAISSVASRVPLPFQSHYSACKSALNASLMALRIEAENFGIKTTLIEPGDMKTGFTGKRKMAISEHSPYISSYRRAIKQIESDETNGQNPDKAAKAILKVIRRKNPPVRVIIGAQYKSLMFIMRFLPDRFILFVLKRLYHV